MTQTAHTEPKITPWQDYSDAERSSILEMQEWQERQSPPMSDEKFTKGSPYTSTTWSRLKRGIYPGKISEVIRSLQRHVVLLSEARLSAKAAMRQRFYQTDDYDLLTESVKAAQAEAQSGGQDKLVCYVGDFGCGKTTYATRLADDFNGVPIEAMPSWKNSYYAVCQTIAEAVGLRKQFTGAANSERELIAQLKLRPRTLIFEECEYTGAQLINLWKMITNQTECVVVIFFITRFFNEIRRRGGEYADQLLRRADVIMARPITAKLAERFLTEHWKPSDELKKAGQLLASAGNKKGSLHLCSNVVRMLAEEHGKHAPTLVDVQQKIDAYRQQHQYSTSTVGA